MLVGLITELLSISAAINGITNHFIINIYGIGEVLLITLFFSEIITLARPKQVAKLLGFLLSIVFTIEMIAGGINNWNTISTLLEGILIISFALYYFYEVASSVTPKNIPEDPNFWITTILLFYFTSSILYLFLMRHLLNTNPGDLLMLLKIHNFVNVFCNLAYAVVLWIFARSYSLAR